MSGFASDVRAMVDEVTRLREVLQARYPSDPHGFQQELEQLRLRARALNESADKDAFDAIQYEFYALVESAPEMLQVFRQLRDMQTAEVLRRSVEELRRLARDRPLNDSERKALRETQALYDSVIRDLHDKGPMGSSPG